MIRSAPVASPTTRLAGIGRPSAVTISLSLVAVVNLLILFTMPAGGQYGSDVAVKYLQVEALARDGTFAIDHADDSFSIVRPSGGSFLTAQVGDRYYGIYPIAYT